MEFREGGIIENRALLRVCATPQVCRRFEHKGVVRALDDVNFRVAPGGADGGGGELGAAVGRGVGLTRFVEIIAQKKMHASDLTGRKEVGELVGVSLGHR